MSDLRQCSCGEIDKYYRVQHVWQGHASEKVGVVFCAQCGDGEPFKYNSWMRENEAAEAAIKAWNAGPTR